MNAKLIVYICTCKKKHTPETIRRDHSRDNTTGHDDDNFTHLYVSVFITGMSCSRTILNRGSSVLDTFCQRKRSCPNTITATPLKRLNNQNEFVKCRVLGKLCNVLWCPIQLNETWKPQVPPMRRRAGLDWCSRQGKSAGNIRAIVGRALIGWWWIDVGQTCRSALDAMMMRPIRTCLRSYPNS